MPSWSEFLSPTSATVAWTWHLGLANQISVLSVHWTKWKRRGWNERGEGDQLSSLQLVVGTQCLQSTYLDRVSSSTLIAYGPGLLFGCTGRLSYFHFFVCLVLQFSCWFHELLDALPIYSKYQAVLREVYFLWSRTGSLYRLVPSALHLVVDGSVMVMFWVLHKCIFLWECIPNFYSYNTRTTYFVQFYFKLSGKYNIEENGNNETL